jgi:hypothetical protein
VRSASFVLAVLLAGAALAARPMGKPVRGGLDDKAVTADSVGVLVRFEAGTKAEAQAGLDAIAKAQRLEGGLRVGFFKTQIAPLAVIYLSRAPVLLKHVKQVAEACSRMAGVKAAFVFLHPGPSNDELEVEGWWRYEAGALVAEKRLAFRDDDAWVQWTRRRLSEDELAMKQWQSWPLSELALSLGLPGRDFLERPRALLDLATLEVPHDLGSNQLLLWIYLPEATVLEIRQLAEASKQSASRLVETAVITADAAKQLGELAPMGDRAPWDAEMPGESKAAPRELAVFMTREVWTKVEAATASETLNASKVIEYAWRQSHPYKPKPKSK